MDLRFFQRFAHVPLDPVAKDTVLRVVESRERPDSDKRLVKEIFLVPVRHEMPVDVCLVLPVELGPTGYMLLPFTGNFGKHVDACARILTPFGIVRGRGRERGRPVGMAIPDALVEDGKRHAELTGIPPHLI